MLKRISAIALIFVFAATTFCLPASAASSKIPAKTKITSIRNATDSSKSGSVVVKFKKVKAYGYLVRYATNSKYKNSKIKWVSSKKSEVKVTGLKLNKKYYFKVLSYNKKGKKNHYSKYSGSKTIYVYNSKTKTKISSVKASFKNTKVNFTVKYGKVKYATGYRVQCSTTSDFKKVHKEVFAVGNKNTTAVISGLKPNAKYYFRVRAYQKVDGKRYYGHYSEVKTGQYSLYSPKISSVSTTMVKNKVRLTINLNKVSYATGYCIYISTDKNFKKNVKTVWNTGVNNLTAKVDGFKTNTVYYVKARAYYKAGKNRTYGNYSSVKSVQKNIITLDKYLNTEYAKDSSVLKIARDNWNKTPDWESKYCRTINLMINPNQKVANFEGKASVLTEEEFKYALALYRFSKDYCKAGKKFSIQVSTPICRNSLYKIQNWLSQVCDNSIELDVDVDFEKYYYTKGKAFSADEKVNSITAEFFYAWSDRNEYQISEAIRIVDELKIDSNTAKEDGLERIYNYVCENFSYDSSCSHITAYDMLKYKNGVCQAFAETYELLSRICGIDVQCQLIPAFSGQTDHLINRIPINQEIFYTDAPGAFMKLRGEMYPTKQFGDIYYSFNGGYMKDFKYIGDM